MHHHHRGAPSGRLGVNPPPPPVITRGRGNGSRRSSARSRSRSRSRTPPGLPRGGGGRFHTRNERVERERGREREQPRERERERERIHSRTRTESPPVYVNSNNRGDRDKDRKQTTSSSSSGANKGSSQQSSSATVTGGIPSISLIQTDPANSIVRRILNPEDVKIPRRVNEGSRPIFDREELQSAMLRRMRSNDNEENPPQPNAYIQEPTVTQQRVVAIIREPVGGMDMFLASKDPSFAAKVASNTSVTPIRAPSPDPVRPASYHRRISPSPPRNTRQGRHVSPPSSSQQLQSRVRAVDSRERLMDRQIQRTVEREQIHTRERERMPERERERVAHHHREREKPSRFGPVEVEIRDRSPISRIPRDEMRMRRRSRSHSVTPPPMPEEIRRQIIERQRNMDLRNALSRQPAKFTHDDRKGRPGPHVRGGGRGGRGGFRAREDERRVWVHDMYDGDDEPKKGN